MTENKKSIKILHSTLTSNMGGIEAFLCNLTKDIYELNKKTDVKIEFDFLMDGENPKIEKKFTDFGCKVYHTPKIMKGYSSFIKKILQKNDYKFVHVHKNSAAEITLPKLVKKYSHAILVVHSHNTLPSYSNPATRLLHKCDQQKLFKLADYRFACSKEAGKWLFGTNRPTDSYRVINNGIDTQSYEYNEVIRKKTRDALNLNDGNFLFGNVGRLAEQKNQAFLIKSFAKVIRKRPEARLIIVGGGEKAPELEQLKESLGLHEKVFLVGSSQRVSDYLQAVDTFVLPSLYEGLSISMVEAQASGLPIFVSDTVPDDGKVSDLVRVLPCNDEDSWVSAMMKASPNIYRHDYAKRVADAGYDMHQTALVLYNFYLQKAQTE